MARKGLGGITIARQLSEEFSLKVCPGTINHWIYGDRKKPRLRNIFREVPSPALSYIIGANKGDGCSLVSGCVKLEVTDFDFAETFNGRMAQLFLRDHPNKILVRRFGIERLPLFVVKYSSQQLAKLLRRPMRELLELALFYPSEFLRGLFDAEGHVDVAAEREFRVHVGAENSSSELLIAVRRILSEVFDIDSSIYRKRKSGSLKVIRGERFRMRRT